MYKYDVCEELKSREIAKKYFPNYFENLTGPYFSCYDFSRFQSEYKEYLEAYFNGEMDSEECEFLKIGYNYVDALFSRNNQLFNTSLTTAIFNNLWKQYRQLIEQIATYRFDSKRENSKGAIQNSVNSQILDQLSLFDPLIHDICSTVNKKLLDGKLSSEFDKQLMGELDSLFNDLSDMKFELSYAEDGYHEDWSHCARPYAFSRHVSVNELGNSSRNWRKTRNEACSTILNFVIRMVDIDIAVYYGTFDYENELCGLDEYIVKRINYYNQCLKHLQHSSNYFCYLDKEDKQEIAMRKVLRKN